jgi:signal transduction histidine kinase
VSDTGQGIERKFLPFVFDRFRQGKRSGKTHASGLGLGLAIVREIVELHGGSVSALSEGTDKGTTFIVRLPLRKIQDRPEKWTVTARLPRPVKSEKRVQNIRNNSDVRKAI